MTTALSAPPAGLPRKMVFDLTWTVKNAGNAPAAASTLRFYLSPDRVRSSTDVRFARAAAVARLAPGATAHATTALAVPETAPLRALYVLACADDLGQVAEGAEGNNCRASRTQMVVDPTPESYALIDAAEARGDITHQQAVVYTAFAAFVDPRLPEAYRGANTGLGDAGRMAGVAAEIESLSPANMAKVVPFFRPPAYQGSWIDPLEPAAPAANPRVSRAPSCTDPALFIKDDWTCQDTTHFRIWHSQSIPESATIADALAAEVENVYAAETALFGRTPIPDTNLPSFTDDEGRTYVQGNGGDARIDVYVTEVGLRFHYKVFRGLTVGYPIGCKQRPAFTIINTAFVDTAQKARDVFAHEFFHHLSFTYDLAAECSLYSWLDDATANWAIDDVYPDDDYEHEWIHSYLHCGFRHAIDNPNDSQNGYEDYLLPFFLARTLGATTIRDIWDDTEVYDDLGAIDQAIPGGLEKWWPRFAMANWNRDGTDQYEQWDGILNRLPATAESCHDQYSVTTAGKDQNVVKLDKRITMPYLSSQYQVIDFADDVVSARFVNPFFEDPYPNSAIWAWYRLEDGTTFVEDWTQQAEMTWCRDRPAEDIQQLMVMYSFADPSARGSPGTGTVQNTTLNGKVIARTDCLPERFTGTFSGWEQSYDDGPDSHAPIESWDGTITFKRFRGECPQTAPWCNFLLEGYTAYVFESGAVDASVSGGAPCTVEGNGSLTLERDDDRVYLVVQRRPEPGHGRLHGGNIARQELFDVTFTCPGVDPAPGQFATGVMWQIHPSQGFEGTAEDVLAGHYHEHSNASDETWDYTWSFGPAEPPPAR
ncbi:MAG TPA: CARDB domain-containing protein [Actinomycetota bacterium]